MTEDRSSRKFRIGKAAAVVAVAAMTTTAVPGFYSPALAGDKGVAFLGGALAGGLVSGMIRRDKMRTAAEMHQAYGQPSQAVVYAPAQPPPAAAPAPTAMTPQQKLNQLDKLAAGGYITPEEYKARKKAILDGM